MRRVMTIDSIICFPLLFFDKTKKELRFPILRESWKSGVEKKFKVIPIVDLQSKAKEEYA